MLIPIRTDYRMTLVPLVNYGLVAANVILYFLGYNGTGRNIERMEPWLLHPDLPQLYQFVSCTFLHASIWHLLGNMIFLWVFGNALNDRFGQVGYLAFYLAGGVLSGVGYVLLSPHAPVLGASGAISAVTGAYLVLFPRVRVTLLVWFWLIWTFEISSIYFLLFQFVLNMAMSLDPTLTGLADSGVAYAAHSSGYVFGIAVAAALLATRVLPRDVVDLLSLLSAAHRRGRFRRMVAQGYTPFRSSDPGEELRQQAERQRVQAAAEAAPDRVASPLEIELRRTIAELCGRNDFPGAAQQYVNLVLLAPDTVLPRQNQLDIANQLMAAEEYPAAADAYERFLKHYGNYEHIADIYLMLGLLYGRYLHQYDRAEQFLQQALTTLRDPRKVELARQDLQDVQRKRQA